MLLLRTGRAVCKAARGVWDPRQQLAGMHASCARWLRERDVAVVGCDGISDVIPGGMPDLSNPLHALLLVSMGVHILDNQQLEGLARACAERNRWEFLMTIATLKLAGGTGCPVNPIAVF